jgi:hypothetical protein
VSTFLTAATTCKLIVVLVYNHGRKTARSFNESYVAELRLLREGGTGKRRPNLGLSLSLYEDDPRDNLT